jgi:cytochrome oxidase Cu insertion factor (SCO1/SenC/PrrC family)
MSTRSILAGALFLLLASGSIPVRGVQTQTDRTSTLQVGDMAPDFTLSDQNGKPVKLSDFRGKQRVVLAFFVLAFTGG